MSPSPWTSPEMAAGFAQSPPNETLLHYAAAVRARGGRRALDIGCGAARNAAPLAEQGWYVVGLDSSAAMIDAAKRRTEASGVRAQVGLAMSNMDQVPVATASVDLVIAHGIWNLARSGVELRAGVREAARVARPGAALFVFTFSRNTLPPQAVPVAGETFVFTDFSGDPQCFLTAEALIDELGQAGFVADPELPLTELNRPRPGSLPAGRAPVIYQAAFRAVTC